MMRRPDRTRAKSFYQNVPSRKERKVGRAWLDEMLNGTAGGEG